MAFLSMTDVHKRYGAVRALDGAHLTCEEGEVHALLGPNGSGKSTLNKILTGVVAPDAATITIAGETVTVSGPRDAQHHRVSAVYQELSLVGEISVAANIALGIEPATRGFINRKATRARALGVMERFRRAFGQRLPVDEPLVNLPPGQQQVVEICKALVREPRILVLDEATASLHRAQVDVLFEVIRELREEGVLVIFTSHRMHEIFEVCDRATVLRSGQTVGTVELASSSEAELVQMMIGRTVEATPQPVSPQDATARRHVVLEARNLSTERIVDVSFQVHEGEVLGVGGLQGQGQSELLAALFGAERTRSGELVLDGEPVRLRRPAQAVRSGIAFVPGSRARQGIFSSRPILENLAVPSMFRRALLGIGLSVRREERAARQAVDRLRIMIGSLADPVSSLSGGNQQKVVVGKWLLTSPRVVLLDDPTKGIDVSAKDELFTIIQTLTDEGVAVLLNSSEDRELIEHCDRILVMYEGAVTALLEGDERTEDRLVSAALQIEETSGAGQHGSTA
jgi:ribose transport system ATP-binding protein